ncbi:MAG TPA: RimK/LysX family protein [Rhodanobacteraceae bacterium]|nr:RimK/LysX family protein [Rhodanobacteraceae bacterium]
MMNARGALPVFGWRERVALPRLGIGRIRAKLDTGARSSALHVDSVETILHDGIQWLRFAVLTGRRARRPFVCEAPALDRRRVRDSGGHVSERWFIETEVALGPLLLAVEVSLTDRCGMLFPMLLGRTALAGRILVDPARSYTLAHPTLAPPPRP